MKMNKTLKGLICALPIMTITACSSYKGTNISDESTIETNTNTNMDMNNNSVLSDTQTSAQLHDLQHNNIVYFGLDRYDIDPEFIQMLDNHANFLRNNAFYKVTIEGHADERGTSEYNIALGERRANALKIYLQGKGVSADQITIISYGKEKPAVLGHDESSYAKNRRAILVY